MADWKISNVYHGANLGSPFSMFEAEFSGKGYDVVGSGFYFSDCRETAMGYSRRPKEDTPYQTPFLYVCDLTVSKPFIRLNQDNCSPIALPMAFHNLVAMLEATPTLYNPMHSPLIDFGYGDQLHREDFVRGRLPDIAQGYVTDDGDVNINMLENDWFRGHPDLFRRLLQKATGYDSIIVHFHDGENTFVSWFAEQIEIKEVHNDRQRIR